MISWQSISKIVLKGARFDIASMDIPGKDGKSHRKEIVVHPGAVVILPLIDARTVALIQNERIAAGQTLLELPAGTLEPPEPPDSCARRELIEETGYQAGRITRLTDFYTSPGICTERMYAYLATDLTFVGQHLEATEQIVVQPTPMDECLRMIRENRIRDGKTIATLLYYHTYGG